MNLQMNMEMTLMDALEIVKEISTETIEKESVKVEDVSQEREAIDIVDKLITVFTSNKQLEDLVKQEIKKI